MLLVTEVDCSESWQGGPSDQVGGDLSEGEMEGVRVTAVGWLLPCVSGGGGEGDDSAIGWWPG